MSDRANPADGVSSAEIDALVAQYKPRVASMIKAYCK